MLDKPANWIPPWVLLLCVAAGCGRPVAAGPDRQNGAWVTEVALGEGDTGKPSLEALEAQERKSQRAKGAGLSPLHFRPQDTPGEAGDNQPSWTGYRSGLPDPPPIVSADQTELTLRFADGGVRISCARQLQLKVPVPTARHMGRFAFELWIGRELVERVRFDFPLLGGPPLKPSPLHGSPPNFESNADVERRIRVPTEDRALRALVVDRSNGRIWEYPWPYGGCDTAASPG